MLKAVTRQASEVDAKIKQLNDNEAANDITTGAVGKKRRQQPITTAYFFDHYATPEDIAVMVTEDDFLEAHRELIPSVSAGELAHYERVRATFEGGRGSQGTGEAQGNLPTQQQQIQQRKTSYNNTIASKGKGKALASPLYSSGSKGKGKAIATSFSHDNDDDEMQDGDVEDDDCGGVEADGEDMTTSGSSRYRDKGKGKGKAIAVGDGDGNDGNGFEQGRASDDEGLYD